MKRIDLESADAQARTFSDMFVDVLDANLMKADILPLTTEQRIVAQMECHDAMLGLFKHVAEMVREGDDLSLLRRDFDAMPDEEGADE